MSQNNIDFSGNPTGAGLMDDYLDKELQNILTSNSGIQRPSYAVAGTKWIDTSVTPWLLKMYDGTDDVVIGTIDPSTHKFIASIPLTTTGDLIVQNEDGKPERLASGTAGTVLTSNGVGQVPSWQKSPVDTKAGLADNNTFTGSNKFTQSINRQSNEMDITVTPEIELYSQIDFRDKNGLRMGAVEIQQMSGTNIFRTRIQSNREVNGVQKYSQVQAVIEPDGKMYGLAPSTPKGSVNNEIATANWVNSRIVDIMNKSVPTGTLLPFAGDTAPDGFYLCDGSAKSRTTDAALFAVIGEKFGAGDGSTTFNLPLLTDNRFLEGSTTAGTQKDAGLPNITGTFGNTSMRNDSKSKFNTTTGAFAGTSSTASTGYGTDTTSQSGKYVVNFSATRSSSIYGGSSTVQPKSLTCLYIIKR